ncbi:MAG: twin transmembrane helix small protein [Ectothiorhodospiraceae bacterium]|nr:twin transmembrane helix small protein [Ectothiorhodospiraceae bacterium]
MPVKILIIAMLGLIVVSLFSALTSILRGNKAPERAAKALTIRISLSILLFFLLIAGLQFGIIPPGGL